jgi:hypothetical protein
MARVGVARDLLGRFGRALPEEARAAAYRQIASELSGDEHRQDRGALQTEYADLVARQHGESSLQVLQPLRDAAMAQWSAGDQEGFKSTLERLRVAWLTQAAVPGIAEDRQTRRLVAEAGFNVVFGLRQIAFRENAFDEVGPRIEETLQTMRTLLGDTDPFVRAAQFHQREVLTRQAVAGAIIGGGFLPYNY